MKQTSTKKKLYAYLFVITAFVLACCATTLRAVNLLTYFDADAGYYNSSAILPKITNLFFICSTILFAVFSIIWAKHLHIKVNESTNPTAKVVLCFAAIAMLVYAVGKSYFDVFTAMNSPNKILLHISALACMLFFVTVARVYLGTVRKRFYIFSLTSALFFSAAYSIPSVIAVLSGIYKNYSYLFLDIVIFISFIFAAIKAIALITEQTSKKSEEVSEITEDILPPTEDTTQE